MDEDDVLDVGERFLMMVVGSSGHALWGKVRGEIWREIGRDVAREKLVGGLAYESYI